MATKKEPVGLLNVHQVAARTGWSVATVRDRIAKRQIEFVRMGRSIRFKPEVIEALIEQGTVPAKDSSWVTDYPEVRP